MPPGIPGFGRESIREAGTRSFEQRPRVEWAGRTRQPPGASARTRRTLCCRFASLDADSSSNPVAEQAVAWLGIGEAFGVRRSCAPFPPTSGFSRTLFLEGAASRAACARQIPVRGRLVDISYLHRLHRSLALRTARPSILRFRAPEGHDE